MKCVLLRMRGWSRVLVRGDEVCGIGEGIGTLWLKMERVVGRLWRLMERLDWVLKESWGVLVSCIKNDEEGCTRLCREGPELIVVLSLLEKKSATCMS